MTVPTIVEAVFLRKQWLNQCVGGKNSRRGFGRTNARNSLFKKRRSSIKKERRSRSYSEQDRGRKGFRDGKKESTDLNEQ